VSSLLDGILNLHPAWILAVTGLLVFAEDAIFIGFLIPGETAAVLAGVSSGLHGVALSLAIGVVVLAAIVGDSVGYEIGHRYFGPRVLQGRFLTNHQHRVDRAQTYLRQRGGKAVFLGRFTAFFRAMMPALAGASRMPYRTFLLWNALGGIIWGTGFVVLGFLAGASYHTVEKQVGRGVVIGLVAIIVVALVVWKVRSERPEELPKV
jgi:membrane protein DedA with SNARE-associated domain